MRGLAPTFLLCFIGSLCLYAQPQGFSSRVLDSLEKHLSTLSNDTNRINTLSEIAILYSNIDVEKSILIGEKALLLTRQLNFDNGFRKIFPGLSFQYSISGQWAKGLELALEGKERYKTNYQVLSGFINMTIVAYEKSGDYKRCLEACFENVHLFASHPKIEFDPVNKWGTYMNISAMYSAMQKPDSAMIYAHKCLYHANLIPYNQVHWFGYAHNTFGLAFLAKNMPDSAIVHFHIMKNSMEQSYNQFTVQETQVYLAKAMKQKGFRDSMHYYAKAAYDGAVALENDIIKMNAAEILAEYFESIDAKQSLYYLKIHNSLKENLFTQDQTNKRYFLETEQRNKIAELEKQELNSKNRIRQNTLLGGLFTLALMAGVLLYTGRRRKKLNEKLQEQKLQIEEQNQNLVLSSQELAARNRDLEIEGALEKVRSTSLAMVQSIEIQDVVAILYEKLKGLNLKFGGGAAIHVFEECTKDAAIWVVDTNQPPVKIVLPYDELDFKENSIILDVWEAKETGKNIVNKYYDIEKKNKYFQYVFKYNPYIPQIVQDSILSAPGYAASFVYEKNSLLGVNSWKNLSLQNEDFEILQRFAKVFEQAYVRFLDLKKAEKQAREGQIEVMLERIRSRAMAMRTSEEINALIGNVFAECTKLDMQLARCTIMTFDEKTNDAVWWMANSEDIDNPMNIYVKQYELAPTRALLNAWQNREQKWSYILEGDEKKIWNNYMFEVSELSKLPSAVKDGMRSSSKIVLSASFRGFGGITFSTFEPMSAEHFDVLVRVTNVFELTYTRYLDLQNAEAQAREANIEAAVERVRSQSLAMQNTDDIGKVTNELYKQLTNLKIDGFTGVAIYLYDEKNRVTVWDLSSPGKFGDANSSSWLYSN
jgi:hypothetical protein